MGGIISYNTSLIRYTILNPHQDGLDYNISSLSDPYITLICLGVPSTHTIIIGRSSNGMAEEFSNVSATLVAPSSLRRSKTWGDAVTNFFPCLVAMTASEVCGLTICWVGVCMPKFSYRVVGATASILTLWDASLSLCWFGWACPIFGEDLGSGTSTSTTC